MKESVQNPRSQGEAAEEQSNSFGESIMEESKIRRSYVGTRGRDVKIFEEATWEPEEEMWKSYPHLFTGMLSFKDETSFKEGRL